MSFSNISFILNKPQLSENIGACARAMKNFNFFNLIVIDPKPSFPNDKIIATSVGAKELITKAKVYKNIEDSLKNYDYLIATTARFRNKNIDHINTDQLKNIDFNKKVGFIFGSEASGLSNHEVSYANCTLNIPTNESFKSLNLSHSLIIVCQILFNILSQKKVKYKKSSKIKKSSKKQIHIMIQQCIKNLEKINFFSPKEKRNIMLENLRTIFYRMDLSEKEIRILSSVFATLFKKKG
ncbi:MAG: rRNA methyltransferase [Rickettsiales bacterium TMED289]|nr:MAG: rRNA methyltransferase [Rickettsiales bacterium TMED289]|tara:strand:- start:853 stop:1569 length:717 start_codon:yes stop_codon:yes gene_type:complete